jgi:hypothetical protein
MKCNAYLMLAASGLGLLCLANADSDRWPIGEQENIEKTLTLSGQPMRLIVDNLDGYVHVTGTNSASQVHVVAHKTIRADTPSDLNQAKREVKLDMTETPGSVSVLYDAPWRCNGDCRGCCDQHKRFYEVTYDIDVEAPRDARFVVSTVNGQLRAERIDGDFEVHGVNGGIKMKDIAGSGAVQTVNGPIDIQFAKNPSRQCSFKSVNGELNAEFKPGLSADLLFKTFNGQIYSDFDVTPLPVPASGTERRDGMFVYRSNRLQGGRAGHGGPQISFETLNGGIRLRQEQP